MDTTELIIYTWKEMYHLKSGLNMFKICIFFSEIIVDAIFLVLAYIQIAIYWFIYLFITSIY